MTATVTPEHFGRCRGPRLAATGVSPDLRRETASVKAHRRNSSVRLPNWSVFWSVKILGGAGGLLKMTCVDDTACVCPLPPR